MGGFTKIQLADTSHQNIKKQNRRLDDMAVPRQHRFYSEDDIVEEYEYYQKHPEAYNSDLFPADQISTLEEFRKFWNPEHVGEVFVPPVGALTFDCYFGRTSDFALHAIARWVLKYGDEQVSKTSGSYSTFVEKSGYNSKKRVLKLISLDKRN